ncbi:MAG: hypothetical protein IPN19_14470 [Elusimicrobia bacterium]|nr:hypothetical protein [Elusimicrobiota bacterium]
MGSGPRHRPGAQRPISDHPRRGAADSTSGQGEANLRGRKAARSRGDGAGNDGAKDRNVAERPRRKRFHPGGGWGSLPLGNESTASVAGRGA